MEMDPAVVTKPSRSWIGKLALVLIPLLIVGITLVRFAADDVDFAIANLLTALMSLLLWLFGVIALYCTPGISRLFWKGLLAAPFVLGLVVAGLFEFERLDGELKPRFRPRWSPDATLPTLSDTPVENAVEQDERFVSRQTDFPQFLGPNRDGMLPDWKIGTNWTANPPEILWKQPIGEGWSGFAVQGDVAITLEQRDQQEWVSAYSILNGGLIWHYTIEAFHTHVAGGTGPRSTATISEGRVYACSAVSQLVCLDLYSGEPMWTQELLELGGVKQAEFETLVAWGRAGSPLVTDGRVIVPLGGAADDAQPIIAFDADTGQELWRGGMGQISYASPSLAEIRGVPQILLVAEDHLAAFAPESGDELWRVPWPGVSNANASVSQPIVLNSTHVFQSKGYGQGSRLTEVDFKDGQWQTSQVWDNQRVLRTKFTNCVVREGYVYGLSDGILECIDLATGKRQWKRGRYRQGQLLLVGPHLLISAENGDVVLVEARPDEFAELARFPVIGDVTWNSLTLSGDRMLMRNSDEAACVRLPVVSTDGSVSESRDDADDQELL